MSVSKKPRKRTPKSNRNRTGLLSHRKIGKELVTPFNDSEVAKKMVFSSWMNNRLPEMLWAALIRCSNSQEDSILEFRRIITFIHNYPRKERFTGFGLSELALLPDNILRDFIECLIVNPVNISLLSIFRVIDSIPKQHVWLEYLPEVSDSSFDALMLAIGRCLNHQSQESTDCRWLKVMLYVASGKLEFSSGLLEKVIQYPYKCDQTEVRPFIRACEIGLNPSESDLSGWQKNFWKDLWEKTDCFELMLSQEKETSMNNLKTNIVDIYNELIEHWKRTHSTTEINAKHDGIFGIAFYALSLLDELLSKNLEQNILGRLGLRTLLELRITLKYINAQQNNAELWKKWRVYGVGQAKLNALRFDELIDAPKFIDIQTIEIITSEDCWEELTNINLGNWNNLDLRKMSEIVELKDEYDKYYSWASSYSHGSWGAIRESTFSTCGNPLHRLHRYPKRNFLPSIILDSIQLVNSILDSLNDEYSGFDARISLFD